MAVRVALGAAVCGCAISNRAGELTAADCSDGRDNDRDGPSDCNDLDCQAFAACAGPGRTAPEPLVPGQIGDAFVGSPEEDAGSVQEPPLAHEPSEPPREEPPTTSEPPEPIDEPPPTAPTCAEGCGENQTCVEGLCLNNDVVVVELWDITRVSVTAPIVDSGGECLDDDCTLGWEIPGVCICVPDLKLWVAVDHDANDTDTSPEVAGVISARRDFAVATWRDPDITLGLLPTSTIVLRLLDDDLGSDQLIFECKLPAEPVLEGEPLACRARIPSDAIAAQEYTIEMEFAPTQVPIE